MFEFAVFLLFPLAMIVAAFSDLRSMTISNRLTAGIAIAFPVIALLHGIEPMQIGIHLSAGLAMLALGFGLFSFGWIGGGDAKLFAATALWFGWAPLFEYAVYAAVFGGVLTVAIVLCRAIPLPEFLRRREWAARLHDAGQGIPYGVALAGAALLVYPATPVVPYILH